MSDTADRTVPATPRRLEEARKRGQVARSPELTGAVAVLAGAIALEVFGGALFGALAGRMRDGLSNLDASGADDVVRACAAMIAPVAPIVAIVLAGGVAVGLAQVGFLFTTPGASRPSFDASRLWSPGRAFAAAVRIVVVLAVMAGTVWSERASLVEIEQPVVAAGRLALTMALRGAIALVVLGLADYAWRRRAHEQSLRMTPQEARDERREHEGDPEARRRRRDVQRRLAMERMVTRVERASVVLTADGFAVAVEIVADAARVAAKGTGAVACDIRERARAHAVPVMESAAAAAIYRRSDVGDTVPVEHVRAVADAMAVAGVQA